MPNSVSSNNDKNPNKSHTQTISKRSLLEKLKHLKNEVGEGLIKDSFRFSKAIEQIKKQASSISMNDNLPIAVCKKYQALNEQVSFSVSKKKARLSYKPKVTLNQDLPVAQYESKILQIINDNQVTIISGETGSGKSTQLPKLLLQAGYGIKGMIAHTQPRRIAARSLATRIAEELNVTVGAEVGYKVRFNDKTNDKTLIKLLTDGMLLNEMSEDKFLNQYDAIIIDEAHERSLNIDIILGLLRNILNKRKDLKVIITSATINTNIFAKFFSQRTVDTSQQKVQLHPAPIIEVSGRTFPVEVIYQPIELEDEKNINKDEVWLYHVKKIIQQCLDKRDGDILYFLATERDIEDAYQFLNKHLQHYTNRLNVQILKLYARLPLSEQQKVLQPLNQQLRIILTTNIAETSLTVPNIRYVIDSGLARTSRFNPSRRIKQLPIEKISQASANQRMGRSGRVKDGVCIRLYDENDFVARSEYSQPEIMRSSLTDVILKLKSLKINIDKFEWLEAPQPRLVNDGLRQLLELGALDNKQQLTFLGKQLSQIPVDIRIARILIAATEFQCFDDVVVIAAFLSTQDPRIINADNRSQAMAAQKKFEHPHSDFMILLNIWRAFIESKSQLSQNKLRQWCDENFLSWIVLNECRQLVAEFKTIYHQHLFNKQEKHTAKHRSAKNDAKKDIRKKQKHQGGDKLNKLAEDNIHLAILTGFLSQIAHKEKLAQQNSKKTKYQSTYYLGTYQKKLLIFPGSVLAKKSVDWIVSAEQLETSNLFALICAEISLSWIEQSASHLIHEEYLSPFWNTAKGEVSCSIKKSLFGLILSSNSTQPYDNHNAQHAQQIFVQSALIEPCLEAFDHHNMLIDDYSVADSYDNSSQNILHQNAKRSHPLIEKVHNLDFFTHNKRVFENAFEIMNKIRRVDILKSNDEIIEVMSNKLTALYVNPSKSDKITHIASIHQLWQLLLRDTKSAKDNIQDKLKLGLDDILNVSFETLSKDYELDKFPDKLNFQFDDQQIKCQVNYNFNLQQQTDGISFYILISQLNQVYASYFDWLVPGLLAEKILYSLRSLPKKIKQQLPPVKTICDDILQTLENEFGTLAFPASINQGLLQYLKQQIEKQHRINIDISLWQIEDLPSYLTPYFYLVDEHNQVIEHADDLNYLKQKYHNQSQKALKNSLAKNAKFVEVKQANDWQFGDIPREIKIKQNNQLVTAYPMLLDNIHSVQYTLSSHYHKAQQNTKNGIVRLIIFKLNSEYNYIRKKLPQFQKSLALYSSIGETRALENILMFNIFKITFFDDPTPENKKSASNIPSDEQEYQLIIKNNISKLMHNANDYLNLVWNILTLYHEARNQCKHLNKQGYQLASEAISEHLDWLIYEGFIEETERYWLEQFPRFLKAVILRIERVKNNPQKDTMKTAQLDPYWQAYIFALTEATDKIKDVSAFEQFGWALEEFRLSIFAQEMKTSIPVSEKILKELWNKASHLSL